MTTNASFPTVNQVAFVTVTALGVATAASAIAAATVASTVATVALATLAVTTGAVSIATITAWVAVKGDADEEQTASNYFGTVKNHCAVALPAMYQFVAHTMLQALVQGLADGVRNAISRKIGGEDQTVRIVHENK